jgi:Kef-type K+ transport system membrane component KefB/nucleotide-binding universal stress UspA family protein
MHETPPPLPAHLIFELLVQLAILLFATRALAELARRFKQPGVLGELLAGILLGPSVLGRVSPELAAAIFPSHGGSLQVLESLSWLGMVLLLFLIGAETDVRDLRRLGKTSFLVAFVGLIVPFAAGMGLGAVLPGDVLPAGVPRMVTAAFLATALSISAMPVIAKILVDLGLAKRDVGIITLGASVFDDTIGWMVLAVIASLAKPALDPATQMPIPTKLLWTGVSVVGFLGGARLLVFPLLKRATHFVDDRFKTPGSDVALYAAFAFTFAAITDRLGIHAVFGAFIAGTLVRQVPRLQEEALVRLEAVVSSVLSPIFFAFAGLKVDIGAGGGLWLSLAVLVIAVVTKVAGCYLGGRLGGLSSRTSLVVGAAMSARGAMGLVVAVVGQALGVLSPTLYSVIVIMAIGTSIIAPLLLRWLGRDLPMSEQERRRLDEASSERIFHLKAPKFLVATGAGTTAPTVVAIASRFCKTEGATLNVTHVEDPSGPTPELDEHLERLKALAGAEGVSLSISKQSHSDVATAVLGEAKGMDVLLLGSAAPNALREPPLARMILEAPCHAIALFVRQPPEGGHFKRLMVPVDGTVFSRAAVEFALAFARLENAHVDLVRVVAPGIHDVRAGHNLVRYLAGAEAEAVKQALEADLSTVLADAPGLVTIHVMKGPDAARALHGHALGGGYDLLVVGGERQATGIHLFSGPGTDKLLEVSYSVAVVVPRL